MPSCGPISRAASSAKAEGRPSRFAGRRADRVESGTAFQAVSVTNEMGVSASNFRMIPVKGFTDEFPSLRAALPQAAMEIAGERASWYIDPRGKPYPGEF